MRQLNNLLGKAGGLRGQLVRNSIASLIIKAVSVALTLVLAVVLARKLGPEGYGIYTYVMALVTLLSVPTKAGLGQLVVRETAKAHAAEHWGLMKGIWYWTIRIVVFLAVGIMLFGATAGWLWGNRFTSIELITFYWGLALVPLIAFSNLRAAVLRGLKKIVQGQLPQMVLRPGLYILLLLASFLWIPYGAFAPYHAMFLNVLSVAIASAIGYWLFWKARPEKITKSLSPVFENRAWFRAALPMALISALHVANAKTTILLLGIFGTAEDVGVYGVISKGAALVVFAGQAINLVNAPFFANFHTKGDLVRLQRMATASARAVLLLAVPVVVAFVIFGVELLELVFGREYAVGATALAILALGHLVSAAVGSAGLLLTTTGYERIVARVLVLVVISNVFLSSILIYLFGINGAALAMTVQVVIWSIILWRVVRQRLGIDSSAFNLVGGAWRKEKVSTS